MSNKIGAFWFGANGCEYMAFKGGTNVFEFDGENYPSIPSRIFAIKERIETYSKFKEVIHGGYGINSSEVEVVKLKQ